MKKIYLHVGAHKSASTTLQKNIRVNIDRFFKQHGISFIGGADLIGSDFMRHFKLLSKGGFKEKSRDYYDSIQAAKMSLQTILKKLPSDEVFFSWEGVLGHSSLDEYKGIYTHSDKVAESLRCIVEGYDASVLLIVRRQDEFIESCYLQQIKEGRLLSFEDFLNGIDVSCLSWLSVIKDFSGNFEKFSVLPFELIKTIGSKKFIELCLQMLAKKNINLDGYKIISKANASYSKYGVDVALEVLPKISKERRREVNKILFSELSSNKMEKASFFIDFHRKLFVKALGEDNLEMFDEYFDMECEGLNVKDIALEKWFS